MKAGKYAGLDLAWYDIRPAYNLRVSRVCVVVKSNGIVCSRSSSRNKTEGYVY